MGNTITVSFLYLVAIVLLLVFNELNYRKFKIKGEFTRKFAHFVSTLAVVPFPYIISSHWYVLILAFIFFVALFVTQYSKQLKSIHDIKRRSVGSYLLPLSIYVTFLVASIHEVKFYYILPMLILAICDPIAAIMGMNIKKKNQNIIILGTNTGKTIIGSSSFFLTSLIICIIALYFNREVFDFKTFWLAVLVSVISTMAELFSWRGSDNLTIPLSVCLTLLLFL